LAKIRPLTPTQARNTFAQRFAKTADRLRQINTNLGVRPYRVFMVHTLWTGSERGEGDENQISEVELLPTPLVESLDAVALDPRAAGVLPMGMLKISEVSVACYTRDDLLGLTIPQGAKLAGHYDHIPPLVGFFYEVREDGRGDCPAWRAKYRMATAEPYRRADMVMWQFALERISEDRLRNGKSAYLTGTRG
jgi:hypothetical protein